MDIKELKELIDATIYTNGEKKIKASSHQTMLHEIVDSSFEKAGVIDAKVDDVDERLKESLVDINEKTESLANDLEATNTKLDSGLEKTKLDDLVLSQKIDNLASNIVGLGGDIKGSVKGDDVIELPSVAINGVAPGYTIGGLTIQNIVKNGDFREGFNKGWVINNTKTNTVSEKDSYIHIQGNSFQDRVRITQTNLPPIYSGDRLYIYLKIKPNLSLKNMGYIFTYSGGWENGSFPDDIEKGNTYMFSTIHNIKETKNFSFELGLDGYKDIQEPKVDLNLYYVGVVNITQTFGKGNEPTKEWCDEHINGYINGTQSVKLPMRIKSVGENLLDVFNARNDERYWVLKDKPLKAGELICIANNSAYFSAGLNVYLVKGCTYNILFNNEVVGSKKQPSIIINSKSGVHYSNKSTYTANYSGNHTLHFTYTSTESENNGNYKDDYVRFYNLYIGVGREYIKYNDSASFINSDATLKSALQARDYVENGTLFKNIFTTKEFKKDDVRRQYIHESLVNTYAFYFDIDENKWLKDGFVNNNRVAIFSDGETYSCVGSTIETDVEDIVFFVDSIKNYIVLKINKTEIDKLTGATPLDKFKAYMGNRFLTIDYQANAEQVKLDTSGVVTTHENGTIFIDYIKNRTDIYNKGIEVLDFKELVSLQKYEGVDLVELDVSKAKYASNKLTHSDLKDGDIVFFEYRYTDLNIYGDNTIEYFNQNNVLQSENGKLWRKVEVATNDGQLTTKLEEVK